MPRVVLCALAVLLAHGAAATLVGTAPLLRLSSAAPQRPSPLRVVIVRPAAEQRPVAVAAVASPPAALIPVAPAPGTAAPLPIAASSLAQGTQEATVHFYGFSEVDAAAEPETGWNVQLDTLDAAGIERAAYDVWIDERGRIVACSLLETGAAITPVLRAALEAELMATALTPAVRQGARVASHRRLEIYVDGIQTSRDAR